MSQNPSDIKLLTVGKSDTDGGSMGSKDSNGSQDPLLIDEDENSPSSPTEASQPEGGRSPAQRRAPPPQQQRQAAPQQPRDNRRNNDPSRPSMMDVEVQRAATQLARANEAQAELELELKYGAEQVLALIMPVSLCMLVVVATIRSVSFYSTDNTRLVYAPYGESSGESSGTRFGQALVNVIIIIGIILAMTVLLVVLYMYRCYRVIYGWLVLSSLLLLFYFSYQYITELLVAYNKTIDYITLALVIWNFGWVGMLSIFWKGPLALQQIYLILVSALMALVLIKNLPQWTTWILLAAIAVYDLFAVLSPHGPLKKLVETAQARNEPLFPALIYSSTMMWTVGMADAPRPTSSSRSDVGSDSVDQLDREDRAVEAQRAITRQPRAGPVNPTTQREEAARQRQQLAALQQHQADRSRYQNAPPQAPAQAPPQPDDEEEEQRGVKLGLGDFIFYSVLVGKAATKDDWITIMACYVAILIGLACTLLLLSIYQRALPALPISIAFGLIFYFATTGMIVPMLDRLSSELVFV